MDEALVKEYRKTRKEHPLVGAKQALLIAKHNLKPLRFEFSPSGRHVAYAEVEDGPFTLVATADYDEYNEARYSYTDKNTGIRNPDFDWLGSYSETNWRYRNNDQKGSRFIELESGYTLPELAKDFRGYGMSKNVAWETARASLEDEFEAYRGDMPEVTSYVITVTVMADGAELGSASIGTETTWAHEERDINDAIEDCGLVEEAMAEAQARLAKLANIAQYVA